MLWCNRIKIYLYWYVYFRGVKRRLSYRNKHSILLANRATFFPNFFFCYYDNGCPYFILHLQFNILKLTDGNNNEHHKRHKIFNKEFTMIQDYKWRLFRWIYYEFSETESANLVSDFQNILMLCLKSIIFNDYA